LNSAELRAHIVCIDKNKMKRLKTHLVSQANIAQNETAKKIWQDYANAMEPVIRLKELII